MGLICCDKGLLEVDVYEFAIFVQFVYLVLAAYKKSLEQEWGFEPRAIELRYVHSDAEARDINFSSLLRHTNEAYLCPQDAITIDYRSNDRCGATRHRSHLMADSLTNMLLSQVGRAPIFRRFSEIDGYSNNARITCRRTPA